MPDKAPPQVRVRGHAKCVICGSTSWLARWAEVQHWTKDDKAIEVLCGDCGTQVEIIMVKRRGGDCELADFDAVSTVERVEYG